MFVKILLFGPGIFAMTVLSTGYILKCCYNIKSFLNTHHNAIEGHISAAQANAQREHEKKKLERVMLQVSIIFAVTVILPFFVRVFYLPVSDETFTIVRIAMHVSQITNPFIYSTINRDFFRFVLCCKCHCFGSASNMGHNPDNARGEEDIAVQGVVPKEEDFPMRLEPVEDEASHSVADNNKRNMDCMRGQQSYNRSATDMTFANDEHAPSSLLVQSYSRSTYLGQGRWLRMQGQDLTLVDI